MLCLQPHLPLRITSDHFLRKVLGTVLLLGLKRMNSGGRITSTDHVYQGDGEIERGLPRGNKYAAVVTGERKGTPVSPDVIESGVSSVATADPTFART